MKKSNLGRENSNVESAIEKEEENVVFAEDSALNTTEGNNGGDISSPTNKERHGCVTTWFILMLMGSSFGILINFAAGFYYPFTMFIVLGIGQLVCIISMFNWKVAGFWGYVIISVIASFINLSMGVDLPTIIGGLLSPVVLYAIMQIKRNNISAWDQLD